MCVCAGGAVYVCVLEVVGMCAVCVCVLEVVCVCVCAGGGGYDCGVLCSPNRAPLPLEVHSRNLVAWEWDQLVVWEWDQLVVWEWGRVEEVICKPR